MKPSNFQIRILWRFGAGLGGAALAIWLCGPKLVEAKTVKCVPNIPAAGDVLVTGGEDVNENQTGQTEFFHIATQTWMTGCPTKLAHDEAQILPFAGKTGTTLLEIGGEQLKEDKLQDHLINKKSDKYDPATGKFKSGPSLKTPLEDFAAVTLPDHTLIVFGGITGNDAEIPVQTAETIAPNKNSWKTIKNKMTVARGAPCAAVMTTGFQSGFVLVAGGTNSESTGPQLASAEFYDPADQTFTAAGSMNNARAYAVCTALNDGTVLVTGGVDDNFNALNTAEIYDPNTSSFNLTNGPMNSPRVDHSATLLPDGTVLIAGGETSYNSGATKLNSAEIYDPGTGLFTPTAAMNDFRDDNTATLITGTGTALDGKVLIEGGFFGGLAESTAELYDPIAKTFTATSPMNFAHGEANAALVP